MYVCNVCSVRMCDMSVMLCACMYVVYVCMYVCDVMYLCNVCMYVELCYVMSVRMHVRYVMYVYINCVGYLMYVRCAVNVCQVKYVRL